MRERTNVVVSLFLFTVMIGCNGNGGPKDLGSVLGIDEFTGSQMPIPPGAVDPEKGDGTGCGSDDPEHICLALRYVAYMNTEDLPVVTEEQARGIVDGINALWGKCKLSFILEDFLAVRPQEAGLAYRTADTSELTEIRSEFASEATLLVVTTGAWNRGGSLGYTAANAWTNLPGSPPYGAILEDVVGENVNLIAHELGHYLNLLHVDDASAMMNPVIYSTSQNLYDSQCKTARSAALYFWPKMIR